MTLFLVEYSACMTISGEIMVTFSVINLLQMGQLRKE
jgi:hypothetical protein